METVFIRRYRSIEELAINQCGRLNVLIGRNNSGKSSILSAIKLFFDFVASKDVINTKFQSMKLNDVHKPEFPAQSQLPSQLIDFNDQTEVSLNFTLSPEERAELISTITLEASQMRNVIENMDHSLRLSVNLTYANTSNPFSYINRIAFVEADSMPVESSRHAFHMNLESASELHRNHRNADDLLDTTKALTYVQTHVDEEDWK